MHKKLLLLFLLLISSCSKQNTTFIPVNDEIKNQIANYIFNYSLVENNKTLSFQFLWDGYDEENYANPSLSPENRFFTYLSEYKEIEDYYCIYIKNDQLSNCINKSINYEIEIDKYIASLDYWDADVIKKWHIYHFSDAKSKNIIDGKYLYSLEDDKKSETKCFKFKSIEEIQQRYKNYFLAFVCLKKEVNIIQNLSTKENINKTYNLYYRVPIIFNNSSKPSIYPYKDIIGNISTDRQLERFLYTGERIEVYPKSYEKSKYQYAPLLEMNYYDDYKTVSAKILEINDQKFALLPRHPSNNYDIDYLDKIKGYLLPFFYKGYEEKFLEALYKDDYYEGISDDLRGSYYHSLFYFEKVKEIIHV